MELVIGFLIGAAGGFFIGVVIMALCVASSRDSREEEKRMDSVGKFGN